jgi:hypothetical protein
MKRLFAVGVFLCVAASGAFGQAGSIGIFADPGAANCNLVARAGGAAFYYIVHVYTPGATGCEYWAPKPSCLSGTWLADTNAFPVTIGNSQIGVSVGYGTCRVAPILIQTITFLVIGETPQCCCYYIYPHPGVVPPGIYVVDCLDNLLKASGGIGVINATSHCYDCDGYGCVNERIPVAETSWGRLKTLYSD